MEVEEIADLLDTDQDTVQEGLELLRDEYERDDTALTLITVNEQWKMGVKSAYNDVVQRIVADAELATPVLETLAVIAWKRPILQSEVIDMRGKGAYDHIKELRELGFISREQHGRTYKLKLDEKFFNYFDVDGEAEIREVFADVDQPEPEVEQSTEETAEDDEFEVPEPSDNDPLEQRKVAQEELEELDEELDAISEKAEQSIEELDELTEEQKAEE